MPFMAIKGTFHVVGYSPDGDSIRFKAANRANWDSLEGRKVELNAKEHAQLRIEAIDTLETHYKSQHQPLQFAKQASDRLFALLGITGVQWNDSQSRVKSAKDGVPGYIVSRMAEDKGRPVSYVFDASQGWQDGQELFLEKPLVRKSVNFRMLRDGLAYPTFYDGLFYDLRELFADETAKVRAKGKGLWAVDMSNKPVQIAGPADVTGNLVLLPKLFRRLVAFFEKTANAPFDPRLFLEFLEKGRERVLVLSRLNFTHLEDVLDVNAAGEIWLKEKPEDLVFLTE
jgi:endonuclease YncB( thermonuclease family)